MSATMAKSNTAEQRGRHPREAKKRVLSREERVALLLLRSIQGELGTAPYFTREDLLQLPVLSHVATISRYSTICGSVHILMRMGSVVAIGRSVLCLADRQARYHQEDNTTEHYLPTIRRLVSGFDHTFSVMDIVGAWASDPHLTTNSKRVAVRQALKKMLSQKNIVQSGEFEYQAVAE